MAGWAVVCLQRKEESADTGSDGSEALLTCDTPFYLLPPYPGTADPSQNILQSVCSGDSGGPLFIKGTTQKGGETSKDVQARRLPCVLVAGGW